MRLAEKSTVDEYEKTQRNRKLTSGVKKNYWETVINSFKEKNKAFMGEDQKDTRWMRMRVIVKTSKSGKYTKSIVQQRNRYPSAGQTAKN